MSWYFTMELQPWVYNSIMGAPVDYHIGHLAPRVVFAWGWR